MSGHEWVLLAYGAGALAMAFWIAAAWKFSADRRRKTWETLEDNDILPANYSTLLALYALAVVAWPLLAAHDIARLLSNKEAS